VIRARRARAATIVALALLGTTACGGGGGDDAAGGGSVGQPDELTGYRRDPAPFVGDFSLPDLAAGGEEVPLRAEPGGLLLVYFGYTNCPDFCPTTLSDAKLARQRLPEADAGRVRVAMVTVDPGRDLPVLADYVGSFFDDGLALGTDDDRVLAKIAAPFGVGYEVRETADGTEVDHTTSLYAVDDAGELVLTWPFGVSIDDLAADLTVLLDEAAR